MIRNIVFRVGQQFSLTYPKVFWSQPVKIQRFKGSLSELLEYIFDQMNAGEYRKYNPLRTFSAGDFLELVFIYDTHAVRMILRCMPKGWKIEKIE